MWKITHDVPPQQRTPRLIYPVPETDFVIKPFELFDWWPRAYAMAVGRNRTAALWGAWDPDRDVIYLYSQSILSGELSQAFMLMRSWGAIDPTSSGSNQKDGTQLIEEYGRLGLNLVATDHAVEARIQAISQRLSSGRFKVFRTLSAWLSESAAIAATTRVRRTLF